MRQLNFFEEDFDEENFPLQAETSDLDEDYFWRTINSEDLLHRADYEDANTETFNEEFDEMKEEIEEEKQKFSEKMETLNATRRIIDGISFVTQAVVKEKKTIIQEKNDPKVRAYNKKPQIKSIQYKKAKVIKETGKGILLFFTLLGFVTGTYLGVLANSFHNYNPEATAMASVFNSIFAKDLESGAIPFTWLPFDVGLFLKVLSTVWIIVFAIGSLAYLEASQKKLSRVGHEHGAARLMNLNDFKKYENAFMEKEEKEK